MYTLAMKCVRLLREILGITQQTLVEHSGVSRVSISHYETGRVFPSRVIAKRLDDAIEAIIDKRALAAAEQLRYSPLRPNSSGTAASRQKSQQR
jgi:transcriptional regulator with XRE-family HTH domain